MSENKDASRDREGHAPLAEETGPAVEPEMSHEAEPGMPQEAEPEISQEPSVMGDGSAPDLGVEEWDRRSGIEEWDPKSGPEA